MPKFHFEPPMLKLKETLSAMGMPSAFSHSADFFGIIERKPAFTFFICDIKTNAILFVGRVMNPAQ